MNNAFFSYPPSRALMIASLATVLTLAGCEKDPGQNATPSAATDTAAAVTDANVADKVEQAATPADHENLARYYDERANAADREVATDRDTRGRYERRWGPGDHPMGPGAIAPYDHLIESHGDDAREHRALAAWHREMARHAQEPAAAE